jgi:hypothetical protein
VDKLIVRIVPRAAEDVALAGAGLLVPDPLLDVAGDVDGPVDRMKRLVSLVRW